MTQALSSDSIDHLKSDGILSPFPSSVRRRSRGTVPSWKISPGRKAESCPAPPTISRIAAALAQPNDPRSPDIGAGICGSRSELLCWGSGFFWKQPKDPAFISWHRISTYWGLSAPDIVTAWVAFTPSTVESGCMRVVPGSHHKDQLPHKDTFAETNLLSRGQEVAVEVDEREAVDVVLKPGEMSIHHVRLIHGSEPNRSEHPRIGFAIRYIPTYIRQTSGVRDSATLVWGEDEFGNFDPEPVPETDSTRALWPSIRPCWSGRNRSSTRAPQGAALRSAGRTRLSTPPRAAKQQNNEKIKQRNRGKR